MAERILEEKMAPRRKRSANGNGNDLQAKLDALKADLEALQTDVKGLAGEVSTAAAERMNGAINDAMESVQDMAERVEDWSNDNLETLRETVRNQPLAAVVLSMGAGALLGAILLRR
jgi:ElaB/YqjD/DUF883 family membrane-anchored ribosome-binding protein